MGAPPTLPVINLDNNATTQPSPGVMGAVAGALGEYWHNPSSVHRSGQAARHQVELARESLAALAGCRARELILTSGGTEAIDLAIRGVVAARARGGVAPGVISSRVEHNAIRDLLEEMQRTGEAAVRWAALDEWGIVRPESVGGLIDERTALVAIQWSNNETGAVQPVAAIAEVCRERGVPFFCDGTQWIGKMPLDAGGRAPAFDLLCLSPHKFHGPKGVGALVARQGVRLRPAIHGTQELGRRGGTENVPGIVGAGVAAREAAAWLADPSAREAQGALRDRFEHSVLEAIPEARVNGPVDPPGTPEAERRRIWNTTNIGFPRLEAEAILMLLSERGLLASAGAACSSGSLDPSPVLLAMGVPPEVAHGSLRFSLSRHTTVEEIDEAAKIVVEAVGILYRSMTPMA